MREKRTIADKEKPKMRERRFRDFEILCLVFLLSQATCILLHRLTFPMLMVGLQRSVSAL